jgi:hypothetical protein
VLIDSLLDLGARGELDDCLVTSAAMVNGIKDAHGFAQPPCRRVTDAAAYPGADKRVWVPLTELLGRIGDLARRELRTPWLWRQC